MTRLAGGSANAHGGHHTPVKTSNTTVFGEDPVAVGRGGSGASAASDGYVPVTIEFTSSAETTIAIATA
ncbi:MAG: hypothetical protein A3K65_03705 [Euryarchaeota archaeon RBG_16_68_12]|nr:MAG: hypothetical protein A3K65_03705 [Euryarchaeota archaeon RBG_16_68_12]